MSRDRENPKIARVLVDLSLDREFDYAVPDALRAQVVVGSRVTVPFGRRCMAGTIVRLVAETKQPRLKEIQSVSAEGPSVSGPLLQLAEWMADYYCAPVETAVRAILPGAVRRRKAGFRRQAYVRRIDAPVCGKLTDKQSGILDALAVRPAGVFLAELARACGVTAAPIRALERKGLVSVTAEKKVRDPLARRRVLPTEPLPLMPEQAAALEEIVRLCDECACEAPLAQGVGSRPGNGSPQAGVALQGLSSLSLGERAGVRGEQPRHRKPPHPNPLPGGEGTGDAPRQSRVVLLHGVTGSGKTEVYLQAIAQVLKGGQSAIVLVPEIALTPQTVNRFLARFGDGIAVLHSHLSEGERHDEWHRIREGKARVVIGARSAVFAPVQDLGLLVVDEEHEPSYKQEEMPRYNARDVAVMRGYLEGCPVVLGSATPALVSWRNARTGKYRLAELTHRVDHRVMPRVRVVDMRRETERTGHVSVFSQDLLDAVRLRIERAEQTMLFLNRRGFATSLVCKVCGFVAKCDSCSVSYTYHRQGEHLCCHLCGTTKPVPPQCPECDDPAFKFTGFGTQRIETITRKCFPNAKIQRMDADTTTGKEAYDRILGDFRVGKIDILIGTQMIAKGLHFPNVTLVGVLYADLSLHLPDFRAGERTFQLLAQVAGRAGRGEVEGEVIVQTYTPHHPAVQAARQLDYEQFCTQEIEFRQQLLYPPFSHLICMNLRGVHEGKVKLCAESLAKRLRKELPDTVILSDAAEAPLARVKGMFRYQVMMRCPSVKAMTGPVRAVLRDLTMPEDVTCSVDVDALNLM